MDLRPPPSFWHRRRVFVTGCTGFLGPWLVRELVAAGAHVVGLVRGRVRESGLFLDGLHRRIAVVRGRVEDQGRLESAFAIHEIQTVFHLAAPAVALAGGSIHPAARWALTVLTAADRSIPAAEVILPVEQPDRTGRVETAAGFAMRTGCPVGLAAMPRLFGGGDRTRGRLVPRLAQAAACGWPAPEASDDELSEPYLYVHEAARCLMALAETVATSANRFAGRPVVSVPTPTATGRELAEAFSGPDVTEVVAETVEWYRRETGEPIPHRPGIGVRSAA